ncbi:uncharacterized protein BJ171DRAFT_526681 [Polychytrium aggregatum]|uniref:uncharacterized protein n=1 Tax=Polychytrium aggregatum TaxID=110093 RepID=UPI0022FED150|nr:uncharacterized protein BJ171DRAFT_526681 [Polychytrium aggregatum]KAI9193460.1 hypothetical protein BJ171DRAFT_526681 [Polychytrium aggregatum]
MSSRQKKWESTAEVWGKYQSITTAFILIDGGVHSLFYSWPLVDSLRSLIPSFFTPFSIPGVAAIVFGVLLLLLETLPFLKPVNAAMNFWPKIILFLLAGAFVILQFSNIWGASALLITSITFGIAAFSKEPPREDRGRK